MFTEDNIDEELNGICGKQNPFGVSAGYFSELEQKTLRAVFLEDLKVTKADPGFSVPEGYFEDLSGKISTEVHLIHHKKNSFTVPNGYFNALEQKIQTQIKPEKKGAVVRRLFTGSPWKYATAACLVLALGSTLWFIRSSTNYNVQNELSSLADTDIESYLEENTGSNDMGLLIENIDHDLNVKPAQNQLDRAILKDYIETQL